HKTASAVNKPSVKAPSDKKSVDKKPSAKEPTDKKPADKEPLVDADAASTDNIADSPLFIASRPRKPVKHVFMDLMYGNHTTTFMSPDTTQFGNPSAAPGGRNSSVNNGYSAYFEVPVNDHQDVDVTLIRDVVTSATPFMYVPAPSFINPSNNTRQFTTRASVKDTRSSVNVKTTYYADNFSLSFNGGLSAEEDYDSLFFGVKSNIDFNNNNSTITLGTSFARNESDPISDQGVARTAGVFDHGISNSEEYLFGFTQIFTPWFLAQQNLYYSQEHGYLSDPYKRMYWNFSPITVIILPDNRPTTRHIWSTVTHLAFYIGGPALHLRYRYFSDSWGIRSGTLETQFKIPFGKSGWTIVPGLRYYTQTKASFYQLYGSGPVPTSGFWSSDYRLAAFGQWEGMLEIQKEFAKTWRAYIGYDYAYRKGTYKAGQYVETQPGEIQFTQLRLQAFYVGLQKVFK
ncbi:MAG: DUF3570 domain-containing protein, partial [Coxiellaceae bacterium]|nr:DUF3570 domain-containing protein [Coxiellaceae bacterium]